MIRIICYWLAILSLSLLTAPAIAAPAPRVAFLVGNWDYDGNKVPSAAAVPNYLKDLNTPCQGTAKVEAELKALDFTVSSYCNLTRSQFQDNFDTFSRGLANLPRGSIVFIYYAGHGAQYHGNVYSLPVAFDVDLAGLANATDQVRTKTLNADGNNISHILNSLPDSSTGIRVVLSIYSCRDAPFPGDPAYNENVMPEAGPNVLVQYSTTAGYETPDELTYANQLSQELAKGNDIATVITQVEGWYYREYDAGRRDSYPQLFTGAAFTSYKFEPLSLGTDHPPSHASIPAPIPVPTGVDKNSKLTIQGFIAGRIKLDFLWCQGEGGDQRFAQAMQIAQAVKARSKEFDVGRIRVLPLSVELNHHGNYNAYRNLMRYDAVLPYEKPLLDKVARAFPDVNFLPVRGVGVTLPGHKMPEPTLYYVSAFLCEGAP
jgi:hypothetical protein